MCCVDTVYCRPCEPSVSPCGKAFIHVQSVDTMCSISTLCRGKSISTLCTVCAVRTGVEGWEGQSKGASTRTGEYVCRPPPPLATGDLPQRVLYYRRSFDVSTLMFPSPPQPQAPPSLSMCDIIPSSSPDEWQRALCALAPAPPKPSASQSNKATEDKTLLGP